MIISTIVMSLIILFFAVMICCLIVSLHNSTGSGYDKEG